MSSLQFLSYFDKDSNTFSYLVWEMASRAAVVIDPVLNFDPASGRTSTVAAERIVQDIKANQLQLTYILETHVHADHLSGAAALKALCGGAVPVGIGEQICRVQQVFGALFALPTQADGRPFDLLLADDATLPLGGATIRVLHTPGHTPACVSYLIDDLLFVGDTLFMPDFGTARCDFPGGDAATLYRSIQKLFALPDNTRMLMCHDYGAPGRPDVANETSVGAQKAQNIHVGQSRIEADFVTLRTSRDATLSMPKLLLPAVQVNMQAGELPAAEANGIRYLKLPLNQF
ncbi:MBL fold metallo-hydrolase [Rheinheimera texasensis]|uniref:MBL fold metallo-hydrolase n=1 Tax=Rheinheimera texasensis TaxID=306205 RepID=UPI0032B17359